MRKNQNRIQATLDLATAADHIEGLNWYPTCRDAAYLIAQEYEIKVEKVIAVISALSPRNNYKRNLVDAESIVEAYLAGGKEQALEQKVCTFNSNKRKSVAILESTSELFEDYLDILSGPKLREFARCINGIDDCTIDGHAYSIWTGHRIPLADVPRIGVKLRAEIKKDYAAVAKRKGLKTSELQAITWVAYRRIHNIG